MLIEPESKEDPTTKRANWKKELIFWTTLLANLITILFCLYQLFGNLIK